MKTLKLDLNKWRCGNNSPLPQNRMGEGPTKLLNSLGYMCCLGQFTQQLNPAIMLTELKNQETPASIGKDIPLLTDLNGKWEEQMDSELVGYAIDINDDQNTTIEEKIEGLKTIFKDQDYELEIIPWI